LKRTLDIKAMKALRIQHGWSQEYLAHLVGVSITTLNRWERGRSKPHHILLRTLMNILNTKPYKEEEHETTDSTSRNLMHQYPKSSFEPTES